MLRNIILLVKDTSKTSVFFQRALGLSVKHQTDDLVEMFTGSTPLILKGTYEVPSLTVGYSPILTFDVKDLDETVKVTLELGGMLDGPIQFPAHGKFGSIRTPDGHIIGLFEPTK